MLFEPDLELAECALILTRAYHESDDEERQLLRSELAERFDRLAHWLRLPHSYGPRWPE